MATYFLVDPGFSLLLSTTTRGDVPVEAGPIGRITFGSAGAHDWVSPVGLGSVRIESWGGGGGGGGGGATSGGGGGGGGGYAAVVTAPLYGATVHVTVGAAGAAGASKANGTSGALSKAVIGSTTVTSAEGGHYGFSQDAGGAPGNGTVGGAKVYGGPGGDGDNAEESGGGGGASGNGVRVGPPGQLPTAGGAGGGSGPGAGGHGGLQTGPVAAKGGSAPGGGGGGGHKLSGGGGGGGGRVVISWPP